MSVYLNVFLFCPLAAASDDPVGFLYRCEEASLSGSTVNLVPSNHSSSEQQLANISTC